MIDGLDQLEEGFHQESFFEWFPERFPPSVCVILSAIHDSMVEFLQSHQWSSLSLPSLSKEQRYSVVRLLLDRYQQELEPQQIQRITADNRTANPLYLRTSLEELRGFVEQDEQNARLHYYMKADDLQGLFQRVLERIEIEFGKELTTSIFTTLWGSRQGITEYELQELCHTSPPRLAQFLQRLDYHLMRNHGRISFFHTRLREAVEQRYIASTDQHQHIHRALGEWFSGQPVNGRRAEEEPWQWSEAKEWDKLRDSLTNLPLFVLIYKHGGTLALLKYWQLLPKDYKVDIGELYLQAINDLELQGGKNTL